MLGNNPKKAEEELDEAIEHLQSAKEILEDNSETHFQELMVLENAYYDIYRLREDMAGEEEFRKVKGMSKSNHVKEFIERELDQIAESLEKKEEVEQERNRTLGIEEAARRDNPDR